MTTSPSSANHANVLLIANRTCPCPDVLAAVREQAGEHGQVYIVSPALNARIRHYVSDFDAAVASAQVRLDEALAHLRGLGVAATGEVGDGDPLQAVRDVLRARHVDRFVISTYPKGQSNWLERDLPGKLEREFKLPVTHLVSRYELAAAA